MPVKRSPNAIQVNGAYFFVKDPDATMGLFQQWRRLGGLGSITLPAPSRERARYAKEDGTTGNANVVGRGVVSGSVGALNASQVHFFMEEKFLSGAPIECAVIRAATAVAEGGQAISIPGSSASGDRLNIGSSGRAGVVAHAAEGMLASSGGSWEGILEIQEDGEWIDLTGSIGSPSSLRLRNPGRKYGPVTGVVNEWSAGDMQAGGGMTSEFQVEIGGQLMASVIEERTELVYALAGGWTI